MKRIALFVLLCLALASCGASGRAAATNEGGAAGRIMPGAESVDEYLPLLAGKRVALLSNQTGMVTADKHVLDTLISLKVNVVAILSPEHGFRGTADAGERVRSSVDAQTGVPIKSLYDGRGGVPSQETMDSFDVLVFDLQDVGCRFYTYNVTMAKMMAACASTGKKMIVLDRPNPIGFYVDGPVLDLQKYRSGVGWLPVPVCHGMTLGELAMMINGEGWLPGGARCDLTVIRCRNYTHRSKYELPVRPSPNLPDMRSIYLYPSMCYFEATPVSLGRGTDKPFQMYGHPDMKGDFSFTPASVPGAKNPPQKDKLCHGVDLRTEPSIDEINAAGINLQYIIDAYNNLAVGDAFFRSFFENLIGRGYVREMIEAGAAAEEIKARWAPDVEAFKALRRPYLLYEE